MNKPDPKDYDLGRADFESRTWEKLAAYMTAQLQYTREVNDRPQNTELETATLRGKISKLKELLDLAKPGPAQAAAPE